MAVHKERKCDKCRETCLRAEMVEYTPIGCKNMRVLCKKCYKIIIENEKFSNGICKIFGIKSPGPIIWKQRKKLREEQGYTDDIILECLDYVYNVRNLKKISETLVLVTPENISSMLLYKQNEKNRIKELASSLTATKMEEYVVPIKENTALLKEELNPDDWLDFD